MPETHKNQIKSDPDSTVTEEEDRQSPADRHATHRPTHQHSVHGDPRHLKPHHAVQMETQMPISYLASLLWGPPTMCAKYVVVRWNRKRDCDERTLERREE